MLGFSFGSQPHSTNEILRIVQSSTARKAKMRQRLDYYSDQQSEDLARLIAQSWAEPEQFRLFHVNIMRKIIHKIAMVYRQNPQRSFVNFDQAKGEDLYRALGANNVLKKANRLTKLCRAGLLQVRWNGTGPTLHYITPDRYDLVGGTPEAPERVIITRPGPSQRDTVYIEWTAQTFRTFDHAGRPVLVEGNPDGVNPFGVLPFVPTYDEIPDDDEFFPAGGDDLVESQRAINIGLVNLWRAIELQSHGQAWASGVPVGDSIATGPDRAITLPPDGKFGYAAPNTPVREVLGALEFLIKQTAIANDLPANAFELDPVAESGAARLQESRDLLEARADSVEIWRKYEKRLFEVVKSVVNTHKPGSIPTDAALTIDFGEISESLSESDRVQSYMVRQQLGIWSQVDSLLADNPDIGSREAALEELRRRKAERDELTPPAPIPTEELT